MFLMFMLKQPYCFPLHHIEIKWKLSISILKTCTSVKGFEKN